MTFTATNVANIARAAGAARSSRRRLRVRRQARRPARGGPRCAASPSTMRSPASRSAICPRTTRRSSSRRSGTATRLATDGRLVTVDDADDPRRPTVASTVPDRGRSPREGEIEIVDTRERRSRRSRLCFSLFVGPRRRLVSVGVPRPGRLAAAAPAFGAASVTIAGLTLERLGVPLDGLVGPGARLSPGRGRAGTRSASSSGRRSRNASPKVERGTRPRARASPG